MGVPVRFVSPLILLAGGVGLLTWAVISPHPVLYVVGVLAAAAAVAGLSFLLFRTRAEQREGSTPASRRARVAAGGVGTALALVLAVVLVGVPLVARWLPAQEGIIQETDLPRGLPVVVAGHTYLAYGAGKGPEGASLIQADLADGSLAWSIAGTVYLTSEGAAVTEEEGVIRYYDSEGELLWETEVPYRQHSPWVVAARSGHVVVYTCEKAGESTTECHYIGLDTSGDTAWEHDAPNELPSEQINRLSRGDGPLPVAMITDPSGDEEGRIVDPVSGEIIARYPNGQSRVYGTTLVVVDKNTENNTADCRVHGYRLGDGEQLWETTNLCPERESVSLRRPEFSTGDPSVAYADVSEGLEEPTDSIAVDLEDGQTQRFQRADFAGDDAAHPASDRNIPDLYKEYSLEDAAVGDLLLRWQGTDVTAASAGDGEPQWQADLPGEAVWYAAGDSDTVVAVTQALPGHNPFVPASSDDPPSIGSYVTVLDGHSGEIVSSTLFYGGTTGRIAVTEPHQVLLQTYEGSVLIGAQQN